MKIILSILFSLLFLINIVYADPYTADVTWAAPITRINNVPFSLSEVKGYTIYYGLTSNFGTTLWLPITSQWASLSSMEYIVKNLPTGTYYFALTCTDTYNQESAKTVTQSKYISPPVGPTNTTVITGLKGY